MTDRIAVGKQWNQLLAMAWHDEDLRGRLLQEPGVVLAEYGIAVPPGVEVHTHQNSDHVIHLVIPTRPSREIADIKHADAGDSTYFYTIF